MIFELFRSNSTINDYFFQFFHLLSPLSSDMDNSADFLAEVETIFGTRDLYAVLGVEKSAEPTQIRFAPKMRFFPFAQPEKKSVVRFANLRSRAIQTVCLR